MLELRNVTIRLKKDGRYLAEDLSFTLKGGDKAVMIGEEGNGKSTLLKYIFNPGLIEDYCEFSGDVVKRGRVAYLSQFMDKKEEAMTVGEYFADAEYYLHTEILGKLGLTVDFITSDQTVSSLSGGERVKIRLAKLLMEEPDVLLLDEPTNDLDIFALTWLEGFIKESRMPILYISHDETLIENTANVILHMEQIIRKTKCRVSVARCPYREYMDRRSENLAHQGQVARKQRDDFEKQMEKWRQIYNRVDHEQRTISRQDPGGGRLLKKKMHTVLSMEKRFERQKEDFIDFPQTEEAILAKFDENITVPGGKTVLDFSLPELCAGGRVLARGVNIRVTGNVHVGITGRNGVGKSSLFSLFWDELKGRRDIVAAYMPQNYADALDFDKTPVGYLADNYTKEQVTKARTYMGSMKFTHDEMTGKIGDLSGGQQAKIIFLDMILRRANVLLLDEPTRNFSPLSCPVVRDALRNFGGTIISISHDRKYLSEVCDKVYELREDGLFPAFVDGYDV